jgi:hypothetical protein
VIQDDQSEKVDFPNYLQHVLPSEWIPSWDADSLAAGAIAAKTYAAYRAMSGHAQTGGPDCFDIYGDTRDQVYNPDYSYPTTDLAVDAALGSILYQDGGLFLSHYYAGASDDPCAPVEGQYAGWMSQWGTQTCATPPKSLLWPDIVTTFYADTTWKYLHNFMMNPEASSDPSYMWATLYGTLARTEGGYNGSWSWTVTATDPDRSATLRQDRKWNGTPTTTYHAEAALRCLTSNTRDCKIDVKVFAITSGGDLYGQTRTITVPNDGVWRFYNYNPPAAGVTHVKARLALASKQSFGADSLYLDSPYGGR